MCYYLCRKRSDRESKRISSASERIRHRLEAGRTAFAEVHPGAAGLNSVGSDGSNRYLFQASDLSGMQGGTADIFRPSLSYDNGGFNIF